MIFDCLNCSKENLNIGVGKICNSLNGVICLECCLGDCELCEFKIKDFLDKKISNISIQGLHIVILNKNGTSKVIDRLVGLELNIKDLILIENDNDYILTDKNLVELIKVEKKISGIY